MVIVGDFLKSISHTSSTVIPNFLSRSIFIWYLSTVFFWDAWIGPLGYALGSACQYVPLTSSIRPSSRRKSTQAQNCPLLGFLMPSCLRYLMPNWSSVMAISSSSLDTFEMRPSAIALTWLREACCLALAVANCCLFFWRSFSFVSLVCPLPFVGFLSVDRCALLDRSLVPDSRNLLAIVVADKG